MNPAPRPEPDPPAARASVRQERERLSFVQPLRIKSGGAPLLGLFQAASGRDVAVLICNPFGQEAIRAQRALRVVSERLGRQGIPSLRFDYYATGDSPGEDGEGRLSRWRHDIIQADRVLRERSECAHIVWLGLRLGATLALVAAGEAPDQARPRRIILWDPVLHGPAYLKHLGQMHEYWTRRAGVTDEVLGFQLPPRIRQRIQGILPERLPLPDGVELDLLAHDHLPGRMAFLTMAEGRINDMPQSTAIEWTSNTALASQWVPDEAITSLLSICMQPA